ncbi:MAG: hypothetical protein LM574_06535 [Archaeoglobus sp.]|nr:hypothetical protein [Archaeoglobus sp.]
MPKQSEGDCHRSGMLPKSMEENSNARNAGLFTTNIAHALTRGMGWGSLAFEPADDGKAKALP